MLIDKDLRLSISGCFWLFYASKYTDGMHRVSFDKVVQVMKQTGHDLPSLYKETSEGGLAKDYKQM